MGVTYVFLVASPPASLSKEDEIEYMATGGIHVRRMPPVAVCDRRQCVPKSAHDARHIIYCRNLRAAVRRTDILNAKWVFLRVPCTSLSKKHEIERTATDRTNGIHVRRPPSVVRDLTTA